MRNIENQIYGRDLKHLKSTPFSGVVGLFSGHRMVIGAGLAVVVASGAALWLGGGVVEREGETAAIYMPDGHPGGARAIHRIRAQDPRPSRSDLADGTRQEADTEPGLAARPSVAVLRYRPEAPVFDEDDPAGDALNAIEPGADWVVEEVRRGDTLGQIFSRIGLSVAEAMRAAEADGDANLHRLRPGERVRLLTAPDNRLLALEYDLGPEQTLKIERDGDAFSASHVERDLEVRHRYLTGTIRSSLSQAAGTAGLPQRQVMRLVEVFGWDIDFALDLQPGDRFTAVIAEKFWQDEKVADGDLLAAEFVNNGRVHRAIRFEDTDGSAEYYTPEGYSLRRAFLRTPIKYARISSGFSERRYHPVLGRWRAHRGVDYAAPTGTPIMVTADGRIELAGRKGGYGKTVIVRHGGAYSTLYAHLSRVKDGLRTGDEVRQGEVIGYVGQTGLATGPHLHYEFRVNGVHKDPLTVELPKSAPISEERRSAYLEHARDWIARLDSLADDRHVADSSSRSYPRDKL